jgi:GNAT superfamily N-acetyltransferase
MVAYFYTSLMEFLRVAALHDDDFAEWFGVLQRAELFRDGGVGGGWRPDEWRARAVDDTAAVVTHLVALRVAGRMVAVAGIELSRDDHLTTARCDLFVDPDQRRRGYGTALLRACEEYVAERGRTELRCYAIEGAHEFGTAPNRAFAPRRGYTLGDELARRDLAWPQPAARLLALRDEWAPFAKEYDVHGWRGAMPERFVEGYAALAGRLLVDAPHANLEEEEERWDAERVRAHEATTNEMGRDLFVAVAIERATGTLVGLTELTVSREDPGTAYQWSTLVHGDHRGHRLGGLAKVVNLLQFLDAGSATTRVSTFNSTLNEPMIRVNEALGATLAGGMVAWKRRL